MTPFQQFVMGLRAARKDLDETFEELLAFAEVMAMKSNSVELDEKGFFYVTATGPLDQVIVTMKKQLEKLERIQEQQRNIS